MVAEREAEKCEWCKAAIARQGEDGFRLSIAGSTLAFTVLLCDRCAVKAMNALQAFSLGTYENVEEAVEAWVRHVLELVADADG